MLAINLDGFHKTLKKKLKKLDIFRTAGPSSRKQINTLFFFFFYLIIKRINNIAISAFQIILQFLHQLLLISSTVFLQVKVLICIDNGNLSVLLNLSFLNFMECHSWKMSVKQTLLIRPLKMDHEAQILYNISSNSFIIRQITN